MDLPRKISTGHATSSPYHKKTWHWARTPCGSKIRYLDEVHFLWLHRWWEIGIFQCKGNYPSVNGDFITSCDLEIYFNIICGGSNHQWLADDWFFFTVQYSGDDHTPCAESRLKHCSEISQIISISASCRTMQSMQSTVRLCFDNRNINSTVNWTLIPINCASLIPINSH